MNKQNFGYKWNTEARLIFRIMAGILSLIIFSMGVLALGTLFFQGIVAFNSQVKFGIAAIIVGIFLFIICVRGRIFK